MKGCNQRGRIVACKRLPEFGKHLLIAIERRQDIGPVRKKNIAPQFGVAGGDPRGVDLTTGHERERLAGGRRNQRGGCQVRQVAGAGDESIVLGRRHPHHVRAK